MRSVKEPRRVKLFFPNRTLKEKEEEHCIDCKDEHKPKKFKFKFFRSVKQQVEFPHPFLTFPSEHLKP